MTNATQATPSLFSGWNFQYLANATEEALQDIESLKVPLFDSSPCFTYQTQFFGTLSKVSETVFSPEHQRLIGQWANKTDAGANTLFDWTNTCCVVYRNGWNTAGLFGPLGKITFAVACGIIPLYAVTAIVSNIVYLWRGRPVVQVQTVVHAPAQSAPLPPNCKVVCSKPAASEFGDKDALYQKVAIELRGNNAVSIVEPAQAKGTFLLATKRIEPKGTIYQVAQNSSLLETLLQNQVLTEQVIVAAASQSVGEPLVRIPSLSIELSAVSLLRLLKEHTSEE